MHTTLGRCQRVAGLTVILFAIAGGAWGTATTTPPAPITVESATPTLIIVENATPTPITVQIDRGTVTFFSPAMTTPSPPGTTCPADAPPAPPAAIPNAVGTPKLVALVAPTSACFRLLAP